MDLIATVGVLVLLSVVSCVMLYLQNSLLLLFIVFTSKPMHANCMALSTLITPALAIGISIYCILNIAYCIYCKLHIATQKAHFHKTSEAKFGSERIFEYCLCCGVSTSQDTPAKS